LHEALGRRSLSDSQIKEQRMEITTVFPYSGKVGQALSSGITQKVSAPLSYDIRLEHLTQPSAFPLRAALQMTTGPDNHCPRAGMILQALR
jgi:hypothetical protein